MDQADESGDQAAAGISLFDFDLKGFLERQPSRKESLVVLFIVLFLGGGAIWALLHVNELIKDAEQRCIYHYEYVAFWEQWEMPKLILNPYSNDSADKVFRAVLGDNISQYYPPGPD